MWQVLVPSGLSSLGQLEPLAEAAHGSTGPYSLQPPLEEKVVMPDPQGVPYAYPLPVEQPSPASIYPDGAPLVPGLPTQGQLEPLAEVVAHGAPDLIPRQPITMTPSRPCSTLSPLPQRSITAAFQGSFQKDWSRNPHSAHHLRAPPAFRATWGHYLPLITLTPTAPFTWIFGIWGLLVSPPVSTPI